MSVFYILKLCISYITIVLMYMYRVDGCLLTKYGTG